MGVPTTDSLSALFEGLDEVALRTDSAIKRADQADARIEEALMEAGRQAHMVGGWAALLYLPDNKTLSDEGLELAGWMLTLARDGRIPTEKAKALVVDYLRRHPATLKRFTDVEQSFCERVASLAMRERQLSEREDRRHAELRKMHTPFVERLNVEGRILVDEKENLVSLMCHAAELKSLEFSEGSQRRRISPVAWLKDFLTRLPLRNPVVIAREAERFQAQQRAGGREVSDHDAIRWVTRWR